MQLPMKHSSARRALIATLGAAALLPQRWTKPIVDSVMLPAHAQTSAPPSGPSISCEFSRGAEGFAPRVAGGTFEIDTTISVSGGGVADGDTVNARHRVLAAAYDQTFAASLSDSGGILYVSGIPFSVPLPAGVATGQDLDISLTMTSGAATGATCNGSFEIL